MDEGEDALFGIQVDSHNIDLINVIIVEAIT